MFFISSSWRCKRIYETWGFSPLVELGSKEQDPVTLTRLDWTLRRYAPQGDEGAFDKPDRRYAPQGDENFL